MGAGELQAQTLEERLIYWTIVSTWGFWLLGALYVVGPLLGYGLLAIIIARALGVTGEPAPVHRVSIAVVLWIAGMLAMELALVVAHYDFELGTDVMLKSTAGWAKGWALIAIFVLVGAAMRIRAAIVYRATGVLAIQTLALAPLFMLAPAIGLPSDLYVSPFSLLGGPGPEFFDVTLYVTGDTSGRTRWRFFSPWATAAAFLAGIGFVFALYEKRRVWKVAGVASAIVVCTMAGSRISVVVLPATVICVLLISNIRRPALLLGGAVAAALGVLMMDELVLAYQDFTDSFNAARAASSRVRSALASIALHRWYEEAPVFGHGALEKGSHLVEYMKIGSHHTWIGLLFVKGAVGFLGLAVPYVWSIVELSVKAQRDRVARAGLGVLLAVLLFSLADNIEIVAYIVWPGYVIVGIALGRRLRSPYVNHLGVQRT